MISGHRVSAARSLFLEQALGAMADLGDLYGIRGESVDHPVSLVDDFSDGRVVVLWDDAAEFGKLAYAPSRSERVNVPVTLSCLSR